MPVYNYICETCGPFEAMAPMAKFSDPCDCPSCGAVSERALTMPQLSTVSSTNRRAHMINERASDSPRRAKANGLTPSGPRIKSKAVTRSDGSRSIAGSRPWMLSH